MLEGFGMKASMSRKGNCYDNTPMESFWGTLKQELVHHGKYTSRQEAIVAPCFNNPLYILQALDSA